ncbi:DUF421 domain-containing protein [Bacillus salacetis]|uniref:DUF421 domain-containing protein n=1 Tax=Bacillus salacetis TaxID=2315464 RepID=A0A3A1QP51_9BACI|nr:DUF421 domain-containing protein [Bacillus salacetis]RIW28820.1 DUF421 domain-containing protein [Bacillus salacetis]
MEENFEVLLRSVTALGLLLTGARIVGKQTISQMTVFDFTAAITLGAIAANLSFNTSIKAQNFILSLIIFVLVFFLIELVSLKSRKARKFLAGDPAVVIQNGRILEHNMKKMRYALDYLNQQLREKDVFDIQEVLFAIVETNGTLTVLKKPQFRSVTKQDIGAPSQEEQRLPIEMIMDGEVIEKNLSENEGARIWLRRELERRNLEEKEVVYAVLAANGMVYIDTYKDHISRPVDEE